jgi:hypothetical protein
MLWGEGIIPSPQGVEFSVKAITVMICNWSIVSDLFDLKIFIASHTLLWGVIVHCEYEEQQIWKTVFVSERKTNFQMKTRNLRLVTAIWPQSQL